MGLGADFQLLDRTCGWLVRGRSLPAPARSRLMFMVACVAVASLSAVATLAIHALSEPRGGGGAPGLAALVALPAAATAALLLVRAGLPLRWAEALELSLVASFLVFMSVQTPEVQWHQLYWLGLLPLAGGLVLGRAGVWVGGALGMAAAAVVLRLHAASWTLSDTPATSDGVRLADAGTFVVTIALLTAVYETLRSQAVERAEEAVRVRSRFLAMMSHELRTPMNGVIGLAQVLEHTSLQAEQREQVALVRRSGDVMVALIDELLDFSKLEAGQLRLAPVPTAPREVLADVVHLLAAVAEARQVRLVSRVGPGVPGWATIDPLRLRQVLQNLLGNAIKFSPRGGEVAVSLGWREGVLTGEVRDQGIGISPEALRRLFTPFQQASADIARTHGGTGLGLAIARELCQRMGGTITVESEPGRGSRFTFTCRLPACEAPPRLPLAVPAAPLRLRGRVLVVEDNAVNQLVARKLCERLGLEVEAVEDGARAVEAVGLGDYALVLMDCQMPVLDGYQATLRIRAGAGPGARVPIVALTASTQPEDVTRCLEVGMNETLGKPLDGELLAAMLARYLPAA